MKNQKGITLIALVVTIIVLLILAGISIAMLTGDNGIITRTNDSKMRQIEGQVKEEVNLAVQSAKIFAMQKSVETQTGNWFANMNIDTRTNKAENSTEQHSGDIIDVLDDDLTTTLGYTTITGTNAANSTTAAEITITYVTDSYKAATNYSSAKIEATVSITGNKFTTTINRYRDAEHSTGEAY
jgi:competence protein ComGC